MSEWPYGDPARAPARGPLHVGGELDFATLLAAYRHGVFPWYSEDEPVQWWSPNPRFVLPPGDLRVTDSLRKTMRKPGWTVTLDQAFERVMRACAAVPRHGQDGTWITEEMIAAYVELHRRGHAHSVEVSWQGELVGGLYGVAIGRIFHGESMFHTRSDASKVGFAALVGRLRTAGFQLIDCQMPTAHLASLGAAPIRRAEFLATLARERDQAPAAHAWVSPLALAGP
ncbi:MAG: leucyl/phenylalanyl-tRNA/protein transferase [Verrucomicrobiota bacterium]|jgi:leucyl/phenylalanyl-tRNA--protein transferase